MASASASTTIPAPVQKQRELVPIDRFVTSDAPDGAIFVMNVFIKSTMLDDFIKLVIPVVRKMREYHECLFCEVSVDPTDKGHVRIVHGWDKASASTFFRDLSFLIFTFPAVPCSWKDAASFSLLDQSPPTDHTQSFRVECRNATMVRRLHQILGAHERPKSTE
jgi:quinol monooxygenase YgiN